MKEILWSILGISIVWGIVFFIFPNNQITGYGANCFEELVDGQCKTDWYSVKPEEYKVNYDGQYVISTDEFGTDKYEKCSIKDVKNWECSYDDESAYFGFTRGKYFRRDNSKGQNIYGVALSDLGKKEFTITRWQYYLSWLGLK